MPFNFISVWNCAETARKIAIWSLLGVLMTLPAVLLGPHTSLMLVHERHQTKEESGTIVRSPITFADMQLNLSYSQLTATWELLLFKLSGGRLEASSAYLASFDPPLQPADIGLDILWLHPHSRHGPRLQ